MYNKSVIRAGKLPGKAVGKTAGIYVLLHEASNRRVLRNTERRKSFSAQLQYFAYCGDAVICSQQIFFRFPGEESKQGMGRTV